MLRDLKIFREVCRCQSVTGAAAKLNMAQPAVSLAIRGLETHYGVKLFERMNRRLYITEAGEYLLHTADAMLMQLEETERALQGREVAGVLRVGANITCGTFLLPLVLKRMAAAHPACSITATIGNSSMTEDRIARNELDLAIVENVQESESFYTKLIYKEEMAVVCAPEYAAAGSGRMNVSALSRERLLLRERGSGMRNSLDLTFASFGIELPAPYVESTCNETLLACARQGLGIAVSSRKLVEGDLKAGRLVEIPVSDAAFLRNYYLVYHKQKYVTRDMAAFIEVLCDMAAGLC